MENSYGNEEKLTDLLERLQLTDRMTVGITNVEKINSKAVDYGAVDSVLRQHREYAEKYLRDNIE